MMWQFIKKECDTILLIIFVCACIWKPFLFVLAMLIPMSLMLFGFGFMLIRNTFTPCIDERASFEKYWSRVDGRIHSFLLGSFFIGILFAVWLQVFGGELDNIGQFLGQILGTVNDLFFILFIFVCCMFSLLIKVINFIKKKTRSLHEVNDNSTLEN